ncbi:MAG: hypothetical protein DMF37_11625 [Verrucomicrobia bacterium]|nr:MAG: hypothetical protein DMF37_11625 [Verrucomicrobiota bacterium]
MIFQRGNHTLIFVGVQKIKGERQPLPGGNDCQDVEQENEQIIGVSRFGRKRFLVNQFEVNQPRPASLLVIDNIGHARIAVRPRTCKFIAPELMSPAIFAGCRFQHLPRQCTAVHVFPEAFTRQLAEANRLCSRSKNTKPITVQHFETLHFPPLPVFGLAPKTDRYA